MLLADEMPWGEWLWVIGIVGHQSQGAPVDNALRIADHSPQHIIGEGDSLKAMANANFEVADESFNKAVGVRCASISESPNKMAPLWVQRVAEFRGRTELAQDLGRGDKLGCVVRMYVLWDPITVRKTLQA